MQRKITVTRYLAFRADGTPTVVIVRTTYVEVPAHGDTDRTSSPVSTSLETDRRETLNWRAKGTYEVLGSREIIRCHDPNAP
jgi:hypothetical protein